MQFLAQFPLRDFDPPFDSLHDNWLFLFQCQNNPGMCDEWDPNNGGNAALLVAVSDEPPLSVPPGNTLLPSESLVAFVEYDNSAALETPDDAYCRAVETGNGKVLGKIGGVPLWIQNDETPTCDCGERMTFVVQLEATGGGGIDFGDMGAGYAFVCPKCTTSAKFLWQCS